MSGSVPQSIRDLLSIFWLAEISALKPLSVFELLYYIQICIDKNSVRADSLKK